jgi:hypothetical protein
MCGKNPAGPVAPRRSHPPREETRPGARTEASQAANPQHIGHVVGVTSQSSWNKIVHYRNERIPGGLASTGLASTGLASTGTRVSRGAP